VASASNPPSAATNDDQAANEATDSNKLVLRSPRGASSTPLLLQVLSTVQVVIAAAFASLWLLMSQAVQRTTDFPAFLAGWHLVVRGHASQLYDLDAQKLVQQKLIGGSFANGVLPFVNPPYVATLFGALGRLSLSTGYWVWAAMNVGLLVMLFSLLRKILCLDSTQWRRYALWALAAAPVWSTLMGGTFSLWVCVGVAGLVLAMQEGREFSGGVWLGLVAFQPQYLPAILVLLVARRSWRTLGGFAGAMAALLAVSLPFVGVDGYSKFASLLLRFTNEGAKYSAHSELMWNVRGLLTRIVERGTLGAAKSDSWLTLKHDALTSRISLALFACGLVVVFWARRFHLRFHLALTICTMVILSPHGHVHDTILMLVAVGLAWSIASESGAMSTGTQSLIALSTLTLSLAFFGSRDAVSLFALATYIALARWIWTLRSACLPGHQKQRTSKECAPPKLCPSHVLLESQAGAKS
jgi:Glycosyltransferase family 87